MPLRLRHLRQRCQEILVERIASRHRPASSRPSRPRTGGAARPGRSVRRRRWRVRRRRHRARTARRRADRGRSGGRAPPRRPGIRRGSWRVRGRDCGSTRSTMTRLNRSDQVSSSATRMPAALQRGGKPRPRSVVAVAARRWPGGRCRQSARRLRRRVRRSGSWNGSASRPRKVRTRVPAVSAASAEDRRAILHQRLVGLARPIPFEHGEFRVVQRPALAVAVHTGEARRSAVSPAASSFLQANSGRGVQVERRRARRRAPRPRSRRRADAPRCRARPAASPVRPRRNPARRRSPAGPPGCGCAPIRNGRRSAWTCGRPPGRGGRAWRCFPCPGSVPARSGWRFARR